MEVNARALPRPGTGAFFRHREGNMRKLNLTRISFGGASAIVTSIGLIIGFGAAAVSRPTIVAGLLIVGLADNVTDALSMHIYQESEKLAARSAFVATLSNFATRIVISLSFVFLVVALPHTYAFFGSLVWGLSLLAGLTWLVARDRGASVILEVCKHVGIALLVILLSREIGISILAYIH
jgi:VIT1/CCC1 family predicted Fe2+/Mn2+ transporter